MTMIKTRTGTELYVKDWGQGRPIVLLHGWPLTSDTWDDFAMEAANTDADHSRNRR
ncbi:alpha/beta hydrolase [Rhizobium lemnae]|uniref:Alpha/beta fold hydrolase n=1 Tax=Rhizobium lemnae TaxID=1214924 RepID=A0ABV8EA27_9HYPH|nr:alpha/beta hydrolase [Rhizobium lemnae]MCJ8508117.1 alpha/beta hydrolase [Rhizobium lemnae]